MRFIDQPRMGPTRRPDPTHARTAARKALELCANADALAREATAAIETDELRVLTLMEQRDEMLQDLTEHLVTLKQARPTADNPLFAHSAQVLDEADALIAEVCTALDRSQRATVELLSRLARRSDELRAELDAVQRAGNAGLTYARDTVVGAAVDFRR